MAAYTIVDYHTPVASLIEVTAAMETKLETLDSTNNPLYHVDVQPTAGGAFIGIILYKG